MPSTITSTGTLNIFRKARKPKAAGHATNCLACPIEKDCTYSARRIYFDQQLAIGNTGWPVKIVVPDIEDIWETHGKDKADEKLLGILAEDYSADTPDAEIKKRNWFGRCVWESDNDVCDDQLVTMTWDDEPLDEAVSSSTQRNPSTINGSDHTVPAHANIQDESSVAHRGAKTAYFHMISSTQQICSRRGRIYGTRGEISYDSSSAVVHDFAANKTTTHYPAHESGGGHGGGDSGLAANFVSAVAAVKAGAMDAERAQAKFLGCSLEEVVRSHVAVFAAEEARRTGSTVRWKEFWDREVESHRTF